MMLRSFNLWPGCVAAAIAASCLAVAITDALASDEPDELMPGIVVLIKPAPLFKAVSKPDVGSSFDLPDEANDPTLEGAVLDVVDTAGMAGSTVVLPAAGWKGLGSPAGSKGYKYRGAGTPSDPCRVVLLKRSVVKMVCAAEVATPFTGDVGIVLTAGTNSKRYCATFGGDESRNDESLLKRRRAPAPVVCAIPATTTTTTTTTTTSTTLPSVAFRMTDLDLHDPHLFGFAGICLDLTSNLNTTLQEEIATDGDDDGFLDRNLLTVFHPFDQSVPGSDSFTFDPGAQCTSPVEATTCSPGDMTFPVASTNLGSGTCLAPIDGTTRVAYGVITSPSAPCFVGDPFVLTIDLAGIPLTLFDAQIAATYVGDPASGLINGLMRGFIPEATADATIIPAHIAVIGGRPLSEALRGGMDSCSEPWPAVGDKDVHEATTGWWFYIRFAAQAVPYE